MAHTSALLIARRQYRAAIARYHTEVLRQLQDDALRNRAAMICHVLRSSTATWPCAPPEPVTDHWIMSLSGHVAKYFRRATMAQRQLYGYYLLEMATALGLGEGHLEAYRIGALNGYKREMVLPIRLRPLQPEEAAVLASAYLTLRPRPPTER